MHFIEFDWDHPSLILATKMYQSLAQMGHQLSKLSDIPATFVINIGCSFGFSRVSKNGFKQDAAD